MIPYAKHYIDEDDILAVSDVLKNGFLTQGPTIGKFERAIAHYVGAKYAVAVSSGTAALHLAAIAAGAGPDKSLITSPITFVASANAGLYVGAKVLLADVGMDTINMSPNALKASLAANPNARVIIPVHFAGLPCDMPSIKAHADKADAIVIEDASHALGSTYPDGRRVGCCNNSLMTVFSFHPVKAIAAGEGGMITTNDESIYRQLNRLRSHGINKGDDPMQYPENQFDSDGLRAKWYYEMQEIGYNYRITDIQCSLGLSQFSKIDRFIERRRELTKSYDKAFLNIPNCSPAQRFGRDESAHHLYVIRINFNKINMSRQLFMKRLNEKGIGTQVHYIPLPMQPVYQKLGFDINDYPNAFSYYNEGISIPLYYSLSDKEQIKVINSIKELLE